MTASPTLPRPENSTTVRTHPRMPVTLRAVRGGMRILSSIAPDRAAAIAEHMFLSPRRHPRPVAERDMLATATRVTLNSSYN